MVAITVETQLAKNARRHNMRVEPTLRLFVNYLESTKSSSLNSSLNLFANSCIVNMRFSTGGKDD